MNTYYYKQITNEQRNALLRRFNFEKSTSLRGNYVVVPYEDGAFAGYRIWQNDPTTIVAKDNTTTLIKDNTSYLPAEVQALKPFIKTPEVLDCICLIGEIGEMINKELSSSENLVQSYNRLMEIRNFIKSELKNV